MSDGPASGTTTSNQRFAFRLLGELANVEHGNVALSASGLELALLTVALGCEGETFTQICAALDCTDSSKPAIATRVRNLRSAITDVSDLSRLESASSLWCGPRVCAEFLDRWGALIGDVRSVAEGADAVNAWVSERTGGEIEEIVGELNPECALLVANALYFAGTWTHGFEPADTRLRRFHVGGGRVVGCHLMTLDESLGSAKLGSTQDPVARALRLPYLDERLAMYVFLPAANTAAAMARVIDTVATTPWPELLDAFSVCEVSVGLPRFEVDATPPVQGALQHFGMQRAFTFDSDFSALFEPGGPPSRIDRITHVALVRVDEAGTVAAAATTVEMEELDDSGEMFIADRPFVFTIVDESSGLHLFTGIVQEPEPGVAPPGLQASGEADDAPIVEFVEQVLQQAVERGVREIHVAPDSRTAVLRFDGEDAGRPPYRVLSKIVDRIMRITEFHPGPDGSETATVTVLQSDGRETRFAVDFMGDEGRGPAVALRRIDDLPEVAGNFDDV